MLGAFALFVVGEMSETRGLLFTQRKEMIYGCVLVVELRVASGVLACFVLACCCACVASSVLLLCVVFMKQASTSRVEREGKGLCGL